MINADVIPVSSPRPSLAEGVEAPSQWRRTALNVALIAIGFILIGVAIATGYGFIGAAVLGGVLGLTKAIVAITATVGAAVVVGGLKGLKDQHNQETEVWLAAQQAQAEARVRAAQAEAERRAVALFAELPDGMHLDDRTPSSVGLAGSINSIVDTSTVSLTGTSLASVAG